MTGNLPGTAETQPAIVGHAVAQAKRFHAYQEHPSSEDGSTLKPDCAVLK